ncbi:MAG TPA: 1-deoxy-D-xylulose-5-phosphate reductoisomerase, partial [bacterium]|nr:1-deoxy-D-xylulose-5-phosphate reductoisomerase [bacterium]
MKRLIILGSTGSIGRQALEVASALADEIEVVGLGVRRDADALLRQTARYRPRAVAVVDQQAGATVRAGVPRGVEVFAGDDALARLASEGEADIVLVAVVGVAGLLPTLQALRAGRDVALANKETLVAGGALVTREAARRQKRLLPVDSEHAAIAQCLRGE